jgi:hypothetical protein
MSAINTYGNEADKAALAAKVRDIRMGVIHEEVMEELLNGEDRRRKEEEEREYERQMLRQGGLVQQQKAYLNQLNGMVGQLYGGGGGAGIVGKHAAGTYDYDLDKYRNTPTGSITNAAPPNNTLTNTINQIKDMLKKGK